MSFGNSFPYAQICSNAPQVLQIYSDTNWILHTSCWSQTWGLAAGLVPRQRHLKRHLEACYHAIIFVWYKLKSDDKWTYLNISEVLFVSIVTKVHAVRHLPCHAIPMRAQVQTFWDSGRGFLRWLIRSASVICTGLLWPCQKRSWNAGNAGKIWSANTKSNDGRVIHSCQEAFFRGSSLRKIQPSFYCDITSINRNHKGGQPLGQEHKWHVLARATERPRGNSASPACGLQNLFISRRQDVEFPAEHSRVTNHSTAPCYLVFLLWSDPAAMQHENGNSLWKTWIFLEIARSSKFHFQQDMISDVTPIDARKRVCHSMLERQSKLRLLLTPKGLPAWATEKPNKQTNKERKKQTNKENDLQNLHKGNLNVHGYIYILPPWKVFLFLWFWKGSSIPAGLEWL